MNNESICFCLRATEKEEGGKSSLVQAKTQAAILDIADQCEGLVPHADEMSSTRNETLEVVHEVGDDNTEGVLDDRKAAHDLEAVYSVKRQALALAASDHWLMMD